MQQGAQHAEAELNARGGILGRKVEVIFRDDQLKPAIGAQRTQELIEKEGCVFIVGGLAPTCRWPSTSRPRSRRSRTSRPEARRPARRRHAVSARQRRVSAHLPKIQAAKPDVLVNAAPGADNIALLKQVTSSDHAMDPDASRHPGMHKTATVDYAIVLSGEIWALMDEGETRLETGDRLVQRGTNHAWSNRSDQACLVAFILVSAT